jgi:hypothetical protein
MNSRLVRITFLGAILCFAAADARAQACVRIDETQDTLTQNDQRAAVLLLNRRRGEAIRSVRWRRCRYRGV